MAFNLKASLGLDGSGFERGLVKAKSQATRWGNDVSSALKSRLAAAFTVGAIAAGIKKIVDNAGRIRDGATALGVTVERFQELEFAAKQSGTEIGAVESSIAALARAQKTALQSPTAIQRDSFARLGVSLEDLRRKKPDELLLQIGRHLKEVGREGFNTSDALEVMGGSGMPVITAMLEGFEGLANMGRRAGVIIDRDVIERLAASGDRLTTLGARLIKDFSPVVDLLIRGADASWDINEAFGQMTFGPLASYVGARAGGASPREALEIMNQQSGWNAVQAIIDERNKREAALKAAADARANRGPLTAPEIEERTGVEKAARSSTSSKPRGLDVDSLTRIGGFRGGGGFRQQLATEQLRALMAIANDSDKTRKEVREVRALLSRFTGL